jgi:hypothetical protein
VGGAGGEGLVRVLKGGNGLMELPVFEVTGFQTIEEYIHALEIGQQVKKRLKTEERNRQLWGGKYCGRLRRRRRRVRSDGRA